MTDRTPLPQKEIPGWYITFQAAVLQQLPRPEDGVDKVTALRWDKDQRGLKQKLASLVQPPRIDLSDKRLGIIHTFDVFVSDDIDELRTKYCSANNVAQRLTPGQKLKVDLVMNGHDIPPRECINFLRSEGALFLGELGSAFIIAEQNRLRKKQMRIPLSDQWMASFSEENAAIPASQKEEVIPGIIGPFYNNYKQTSKSFEDLKRDGMLYFFSFHDAS